MARIQEQHNCRGSGYHFIKTQSRQGQKTGKQSSNQNAVTATLSTHDLAMSLSVSTAQITLLITNGEKEVEELEPKDSDGPFTLDTWKMGWSRMDLGSWSLTAVRLMTLRLKKGPTNLSANSLDSTQRGRSRVESHTFWPTQ